MYIDSQNQRFIEGSIGDAWAHFSPCLWKSGVVIQKLQFLKTNEKISKNANSLISQTCFMRNTWNMKILILLIFKDFEE